MSGKGISIENNFNKFRANQLPGAVKEYKINNLNNINQQHSKAPQNATSIFGDPARPTLSAARGLIGLLLPLVAKSKLSKPTIEKTVRYVYPMNITILTNQTNQINQTNQTF